MIKFTAFLFLMLGCLSIAGCAGCDADVAGVPTGDGHWVHCEQNRVVLEDGTPSRGYEYLLPNCFPIPHHPGCKEDGGSESGATNPSADMSTSNDPTNPGGGPDMTTGETNGPDMLTSADMSGGFNGGDSDGGYGDCTNVVCPSGQTCNAGSCVPVTVCEPTDPTCWHVGACLPTESGYMTTMCKVPPGNTGGEHEICVGNAAVSTQEGIGSFVGFCP